jgi:CubicO group peptidase (beta-lactamase class C family)
MKLSNSRWMFALLSFVSGCWFDGDFKHRNTTVPEQLDDGWEISTPEAVGLDPAALAGIHNQLLDPERFVGALGFLVIKDGKLVFETYLSTPADRDHVHHLQSTTKSVTSILFGIGRDQGWMPPVETTLCSILVEDCAGLEARKQSITLDNVLTMRSGIAFDNSDFSVEMWIDNPAHPARHILEKPLYADPGTVFYYRDADPQLISYAMQHLTDRNEESIGREYLFGPLGITDLYWDHGSQGDTMGAHGLHLRPRDLAKIGQLILDGGNWHGTPLVSSSWVELSTTKQVDSDDPTLGYGYYWWTVPEANGLSTWGHGGQYAFVVPALRLVMVLISHPDTNQDAIHGGELPQFVELTRPLWQAR